MDYVEIVLYERTMRVYPTGIIWLLRSYSNQFCKCSEKWVILFQNTDYKGYLYIKLNKQGTRTYKSVKTHRLVAFAYLGLDINDHTKQIDHKNHIKADNRVENLQIVTNSQNQFNRINTKGCTFVEKLNKWLAQIQVNKQKKYLGYFDTEEEAHQAYLNAKLIYHII